MEQVKIKKIYEFEFYILMTVSPANFIEYGTSTQTTYSFEMDSLANQWNISRDLLDTVALYDLSLKDALSISSEENPRGITKTSMINANVIPVLLKKLIATGQCLELDTVKEIKKVNELINKVKEGTLTWKESTLP